MRPSEGDSDGEGCSFAALADDGDSAAVQAAEFIDERETDSGTFVGAPAACFDAKEAVENSGHLGFGNPSPSVANGELYSVADFCEGDFDFASHGEFERVGKKV